MKIMLLPLKKKRCVIFCWYLSQLLLLHWR